MSTASPNPMTYRDLLRCPTCGSAVWDDPLRCIACNEQWLRDGAVLFAPDANADPAVAEERRGVRDTEHRPELGGIEAEFESLGTASGELREMILALPGRTNSPVFDQPGYFKNVHQHETAFLFLKSHLAVRRGDVLLDLGADLTWSTQHFARCGARCVALDINHHLAAGTLFMEAFDVSYLLLNADMHLPIFQPESFDVILACSALHHCRNLPALLSYLHSLLRPGGRIGWLEPYCLFEEDKSQFGKDQIDQGINENVYTLDEWHRHALAAGFLLDRFLLTDSF
ncbi:MAG: class I SAM-dependent methyltransferase, partial [Bdellovibrionales bacterium]|nr:class I SAM-dependent methyltransferase [Bdellovibrionales bacterium]